MTLHHQLPGIAIARYSAQSLESKRPAEVLTPPQRA
jgi:hypothetical protein